MGRCHRKQAFLILRRKKKRQWKEMLLKSQQISLSKTRWKFLQDALCEAAQGVHIKHREAAVSV